MISRDIVDVTETTHRRVRVSNCRDVEGAPAVPNNRPEYTFLGGISANTTDPTSSQKTSQKSTSFPRLSEWTTDGSEDVGGHRQHRQKHYTGSPQLQR